MTRGRITAVLATFAGIVNLSSLAHAAPPTSRPTEIYDRHGRVVMDAAGKRYEYASDPALEWKSVLELRKRRQAVRAEHPNSSAATSSGIGVNPSASARRDWFFSTPAVAIGQNGMHAADLDADGTIELLLGGNSYWQVLVPDPIEGYKQRWVSELYGPFWTDSRSDLTATLVAQVDSDAALEIIAAVRSRLLIYDGKTLELQGALDTASWDIEYMAVGDLDLDGRLDVAVSENPESTSAVRIYDLASGVLKFTAGRPGDLAIANVDGDPAPELVIGGGWMGNSGLVVDGVTHAVEWSVPSGFGMHIDVGDIDGDGIAEIVGGGRSRPTRVYDVDTQTVRYELSEGTELVRVIDFEGDAALDVITVTPTGRFIGIHDGATGRAKTSFRNPGFDVADLVAADVDHDGVRELVWGTGAETSAADILYVYNTVSREHEWTSPDDRGPFRAFDIVDVDDDGETEVVYGSFLSNGYYSDGNWFVRDEQTQTLEFKSAGTTGHALLGLTALRTANVDADPQREVFVNSAFLYQALLICYDGLSHEEQWRINAPPNLLFASLAIHDLDSDGDLEIVAGLGMANTSAPAPYVMVLDATTGAVQAQSSSLPGTHTSLDAIRVANVDRDPQLEILLSSPAGYLWVLDSASLAVQWTTTPTELNVTALDTYHVPAFGLTQVFVGTRNGSVAHLDGETGAILASTSYGSEPINALAIDDVNGDGLPDRVMALKKQVWIDTVYGIWRSGDVGYDVGRGDALVVRHVSPNQVQLVFNAGAGLMALALPDLMPPQVAITAPANDTTVWRTVTIEAMAADDRGIDSVRFEIDGQALGAADSEAPYSVAWDTRSSPAGVHTLTAVAQDSAGNTTRSAPILVRVPGAPHNPRGLRAHGGDGHVQLTWAATVDAASYGIKRATRLRGPYTDLVTTTSTSHLDATAANGQTYYYMVVATNDVGSSPEAGPVWASPPSLLAFGHTIKDFNSDGRTDLVWRQRNTGASGVWYMGGDQGTTVLGTAALPSTGANWDMVGFGDFNGDGRVDIALQNIVTGEAGLWIMNGMDIASTLSLGNPGMWKIVGVGDFNDDQKPDIVFRHSGTGATGVWFMDGLTHIGSAPMPGEGNMNWEIAGIADVDRDLDADIVWRNTITGVTGIWYMDGTSFVSAAALPQQDTTPNWRIDDIADFNQDGYDTPDLLWRNTVNGAGGVWFMNGPERTGIGIIDTNVGVSWEIKN